MKNDEEHVNTLNNQWKITKNILNIIKKKHWKLMNNIFKIMKHQWHVIKKSMPLWWPQVDFKKRPAYSVRNPGGILTLFI